MTYPIVSRLEQAGLRTWRVALATFGAIVFSLALRAASTDKKVQFDVPAGDALVSLRQFATQAGEQIMFSDESAAGVKTRAIKGAYSPAEAIDVMLTDTGLTAVRDPQAGAISVRRETPAESKNANRAIAKSSGRPENKPESAHRSTRGAEAESLDTVMLDPFQVKTTHDSAYTVTHSTSITRFNTELQNTPISADIFTSDFMADTASSVIETMLYNYAAGGGTNYLAADTNTADNQPGLNQAQTPNVRGLSLGDYRRDGFAVIQTYGGVGNFDIDRVEIMRGPAGGTLFGASGGGGTVNMVSKQARFNARSGQLTYRLDRYGTSYALFDGNFGSENFAIRTALVRDFQNFRMKFLANDNTGAYVQLAAKLPLRSVLRLQGRVTRKERTLNSNTDNLVLGTSDPRNNFSLPYLVATGQDAATNPVTGAAYPAGEIVHGLLDWENAQTFGGNGRWDKYDIKVMGGTLDTTWAPWLATSMGMLFTDQYNPSTPTATPLLAPRSINAANPLDVWATSSEFRQGLQMRRSFNYRASALVTNSLFDGRVRSQTALGWDMNVTSGGTANINYYKSDAQGNILYTTPSSTTDAFGRSALPTLYWSVDGGPVPNPYVRTGAKTVYINGQYYTYDRANPRSPAYVTALNPLGLAGLAPQYASANITTVDTTPYENSLTQRGYYISNFTGWWDNKVTSLLSWRNSSSFLRTPNSSRTGTVGFFEQRTDNSSYTGGVSYSIRPGLNLYYNYAHSYLPTTQVGTTAGTASDFLGKQSNPTFLSNGHEVGLKMTTREARLSASLVYFQSDSRNETFNFQAALRDLINPTGLNGRYMVPGGLTPGVSIPLDKKSSGVELILTAQPTRNWRIRFAATMTEAVYKSGKTYDLQWNDAFNYDKATGRVLYSNGQPFMVPITTTALARLAANSAPLTDGGTQPLTLAMLSDSTSPYYAYAGNGGPTLNGQIFTNNIAYRALKYFNQNGVFATTGQAGLPVSAIPYAFNDPAGLNGRYDLAKPGDISFGQPKYLFILTSNYNFTQERLRGFGIGQNLRLAYKDSNFYYYEKNATGLLVRKLYAAPVLNPQIDLNLSYTKRFQRFSWRTQLNVNNVLDITKVGIIPSAASGYQTENAMTAAIFGVQRNFLWTNTLSF